MILGYGATPIAPAAVKRISEGHIFSLMGSVRPYRTVNLIAPVIGPALAHLLSNPARPASAALGVIDCLTWGRAGDSAALFLREGASESPFLEDSLLKTESCAARL